MSKSGNEKEISARACAIISVLSVIGSLWIILATSKFGGTWYFSVIASFVPLMFAVRGIRKSREPETPWARFSFIISIVGMALGVATFVGFLYPLTQSTPG